MGNLSRFISRYPGRSGGACPEIFMERLSRFVPGDPWEGTSSRSILDNPREALGPRTSIAQFGFPALLSSVSVGIPEAGVWDPSGLWQFRGKGAVPAGPHLQPERTNLPAGNLPQESASSWDLPVFFPFSAQFLGISRNRGAQHAPARTLRSSPRHAGTAPWGAPQALAGR